MNATLAIARRDLRALLDSPSGWLVTAAFLFLAGVFWLALLDHYVVLGQDQLFDPYTAARLDLSRHLIAPFFGNLTVMMLFVCPAVSMRTFAEEVREHTLELLATSPLRAIQITLGKFLGAWATVLLLLATTAWMPASLWLWADPDPGTLVAGYLGMALLTALLVALGTLVSSFTEQPVVAMVLTFAIALVLWVVGWVDPDPTSLPSQLSVSTHIGDLVRGAVRASDVAYFVLGTSWCLLATWQRVVAWRYQ